MKKLMVLAAVACAALFANAASANWQITATTAQVNYQIYLVGAISDAWTSVSDLAADAAAFGTAGTSGTIAKNGRLTYASATLASDNISKTSADVFFVIVSGSDATDYSYVKADLSAFVYEGVETPSGKYTSTANDLLAGTQGSFGSIPEPTGATLVLLGVAGLALRRRRR